MLNVEKRCARCGWQNEPTARMCGGCGMPLDTPGATASDDVTALPGPPRTSPMAPGPTPLAPSADATTPAAWPRPGREHLASGTPPARAWWRAPLIALVVVAVLAAASLGAWAFVVRPILHAQVDGALRGALGRVVEQIPPNVPGDTYSVPASTLTNLLHQRLPADAPVSNVRVEFSGDGTMSVLYRVAGQNDSVTTHLVADHGRLHAQATTVNGLLSLVESGDEMEAALNGALSRISPQDTISGIAVHDNTLFITVGTP